MRPLPSTLVTISMCLGLTVAAPRVIVSQTPPVPQDFSTHLERLLKTFAAFKGITGQTPKQIENGLDSDRRDVIRAVVWAGLQPLQAKAGASNVPAGARLIDYVREVHGIWGVRAGDDEGKHQFRLSVVLEPNTVAILHSTALYEHSNWFCHVLLPEPNGSGDDDSKFSAFRSAPQASCFRRKALPELQVSYDRKQPTVGEIDLDFDEGRCHMTPSNSDVRFQPHNSALGQTYNWSGSSPSLTCQLARFHCDDSYATSHCP